MWWCLLPSSGGRSVCPRTPRCFHGSHRLPPTSYHHPYLWRAERPRWCWCRLKAGWSPAHRNYHQSVEAAKERKRKVSVGVWFQDKEHLGENRSWSERSKQKASEMPMYCCHLLWLRQLRVQPELYFRKDSLGLMTTTCWKVTGRNEAKVIKQKIEPFSLSRTRHYSVSNLHYFVY